MSGFYRNIFKLKILSIMVNLNRSVNIVLNNRPTVARREPAGSYGQARLAGPRLPIRLVRPVPPEIPGSEPSPTCYRTAPPHRKHIQLGTTSSSGPAGGKFVFLICKVLLTPTLIHTTRAFLWEIVISVF